MTDNSSSGITRRALLGAFAASAVAAAPTYSNAAGFLRGAGDIRRLRMTSPRTGESIDTIYWIEGDYIRDAVREVSLFMRDWRTNDVHNIDLRTIDIMAAAHGLLDVNEPYMLLSGYRSPQTNAMLRRRSARVRSGKCTMPPRRAAVAVSGGIRARISCIWIAGRCAPGAADPAQLAILKNNAPSVFWRGVLLSWPVCAGAQPSLARRAARRRAKSSPA